jgi:dihydropteroate synthase-like protein
MTHKKHDFQSEQSKNGYKLLIITGKAAEPIVRKYVPKNANIIVLPVDVAAFITGELILYHLSKDKAKQYDVILVPGLIVEDLSQVSKELDTPVVKGPRYICDLPKLLEEIDLRKLSSRVSADFLLQSQREKEAKNVLEEAYTRSISKRDNEFLIGSSPGFPIGLSRPPIIMAEIIDAPLLTTDEILSRTNYFLSHGAQIIDIGAIASQAHPNKIREIIVLIREAFQDKYQFALSIDSMHESDQLAALEMDIDLVLSVDEGNIDFIAPKLPKDTAVVIIPTNIKKGLMSKTLDERIKVLFSLKKQLQDIGHQKIVADPILDIPIYPGITTSLATYYEFRQKDPKTPLFGCIGNVTEFIAADPIGINALFGCFAVELGIQLVLVTDSSVKCRGGIKEMTTARDLAYVALIKKTPPKDQGIDLLMAKSRYDSEVISFNPKKSEIKTKYLKYDLESNLTPKTDFVKDPRGSFVIWTNYENQEINVVHLHPKTTKPDCHLISKKAAPLLQEIIKKELISKLDHASYLGRELERAEICLYLGKTYIQNEQVFH